MSNKALHSNCICRTGIRFVVPSLACRCVSGEGVVRCRRVYERCRRVRSGGVRGGGVEEWRSGGVRQLSHLQGVMAVAGQVLLLPSDRLEGFKTSS